MKNPLPLCLVLTLVAAAAAAAPVSHPFVCTDSSTRSLCRVQANGGFERLADVSGLGDLWSLPDGHLLVTNGHRVMEVVPGGSVVFTFDAAAPVRACQRLEDGNTFIAESTGRLLVVSPEGTVVNEIRLQPEGEAEDRTFVRGARVLADGGFLVAHQGLGVVREYDAAGQVVREIPVADGPLCAVRLPNGNTLIGTGTGRGEPRVIEVNPTGSVVWQVASADLPKVTLVNVAGVQRLPNGNTLIVNWLGGDEAAATPHLVEVDPAKKVVWTFSDHAVCHAVGAAVLLDVRGDCTKGEVLR